MNVLTSGQAHIERVDNPADFYMDHAAELDATGAAAFGQPVEAFGAQVAERFCKANLAQVIRYREQVAGFALYDKLPSRYGSVLSIEGRAIRPEFQGQGLGTLALHQLLRSDEEIEAAASVTRNPGVLRVMSKGFSVVSPDLGAADPLHYVREYDTVRGVSAMYSEYVGADPDETPFVYGRYEGGLYGDTDPGQGMSGLPQIVENPTNGVVMVATARKSQL